MSGGIGGEIEAVEQWSVAVSNIAATNPNGGKHTSISIVSMVTISILVLYEAISPPLVSEAL